MTRWGHALRVALAWLAPMLAAHAADACPPDPLAGRSLYLRGGFNAWAAGESYRFAWACGRYELVARVEGEHAFKIGDEGWSADADFGIDPAGPADGSRLLRHGRDARRRFTGLQRFILHMDDPAHARLEIQACPADAAPLGGTTLFLRGSMTNWAALDDHAFQYSCDAYYLNVDLQGRHEFKIADAGWKDATSYGAGSGAYLQAGGGNLVHTFTGAHTLRLAWAGGRPELSIGPRSFADPRVAAVTDPVARSLVFDSRSAAHKSPFGAVVAGSTVQYAVDALPGVERLTLVVETRRLEGNQEVLAYTTLARVPMVRGTGLDGRERWQASHRFDAPAVYGLWFEAEIGGRRYAYQNNRDAVHWTREKGTGGRGEVAELPASPGTIRRFRQTVYAADFQVPAWASDIVYYAIFPERYRNGDPANDPQPGVARYQDKAIECHARWMDKPYRPGSGDGSDAVYNNDFFGGDLQGIIDKLDDIRELGANTIYMTPIFQAASNHKYDTADYLRIDPGFGTEATFERLTREAARRGMRIVLDTSLNHVGSDSVYFDRFGNHRRGGAFEGGRIRAESPYAGWFSLDATQKDPDKQYRGWVGTPDLPEIDKASRSFRDFAYGRADGVMQHWLDRGAAGWRMDVAPWVPDDFWREWRRAIRAHRPDALTVAEAWFDASKYLLGDMFDSTMNYVFRNAVLEYAAGGPASALAAQLEHLREAYPPQAWRAMMNLLSSHDQARALHVLGWAADDADAATVARAKRRLALAVLLQMSYPGAPSVYYGDEVGVTGGEDPYNRATYPWPDQGGRPDLALRAEIKRLIALRHAEPVLRHGTLDAPALVDGPAFAQTRRLGDRWALVATNSSDQPMRVSVPMAEGAPDAWTDALDGTVARAEKGVLTIELPAVGGRVLLGRAGTTH